MTQTFLVTGANGFVGRALCLELVRRGYVVRAAVREASRTQGLHGDIAVVGDVGTDTDWTAALSGRRAVIHLAARVHVMREKAADPLAAYREVNVMATERLARQAAALGVQRFVYVSSIGVHGSRTTADPFDEMSVLAPDNPYARSKIEAEERLFEASRQTGMEIVVVRPPLVYGPNNPGNFLRLLRLVERGLPLPLASIDNRRSMIYIGNLTDALIACSTQPAAAGSTYLVSDGEDVSTPQLIRQLAGHMGRSARLWAVPPGLFHVAGALTGKADDVNRLIGTLRVDTSRIRAELGWTPPFSVAEGLAETVRWFLQRHADSTSCQ